MMADIYDEVSDLADLYQRLCSIMTGVELRDFVESMEDVANTGNGYGQIVVDMEDRRVKLIRATSSRKPGVRQ